MFEGIPILAEINEILGTLGWTNVLLLVIAAEVYQIKKRIYES